MYYAFLSLLVAFSFVDLFFHGGTSFAPVGLLFVGLKLQADSAANRFLKTGLVSKAKEEPAQSWIPPADKNPFAEPLRLLQGGKSSSHNTAGKPEKPAPKPTPKRPAANVLRPANIPLYRAPNFRGRDHEILGIEENANTGVIVGAFRHWIKRYHPDHLAELRQTQSATDRARIITTAKQSLLERRKQMRKSA